MSLVWKAGGTVSPRTLTKQDLGTRNSGRVVTVDERCRITVVSGHRQVDLAVPAEAPITTYIDAVARLCAPESNDMLPAAWSLGTVTEGPFPPERSLAELGIVDGQILYLGDVIADERADPVVRDVGERVAEWV